MGLILKRIVCSILIFILGFSNIIGVVYASGNISVESIYINGLQNQIFLKPGDNFKVALNGINNGTTDITDVYGKIYFDDNSFFSYNGNISGYVGFTPTSTVPTSDYTNTDGLYSKITNESISIVPAGKKPKFSSTVTNNFAISNSIKKYQNTIYGQFNSKDDLLNSISSNVSQLVFYVNVKPHITDYYFEKSDGFQTTSQVQGSNAEPVNLVLKVKDYNGCSNLDSAVVKADLSQLGLTSAENLSYISCDENSKTAIFKLQGITTNSPNGTYGFSYSKFSVVDEDGNYNDPTDSNTNFDDEDKKIDYNLTVVSAAAPTVTLIDVTNTYVGGPNKLESVLSFSGSQSGETKVILGSDGSCSSGQTLEDWTAYSGKTLKTVTLKSIDFGLDGDKSLYACVKNSGGNVGSINFNIKKDTVRPIVSGLIISPTNIVLNDSGVKFVCSENGSYEIRVGGSGNSDGTFIASGSVISNNQNTQTLASSNFELGNNTIYVHCTDNASNDSYLTGVVKRNPLTPDMGNIKSFEDNDIDTDGLDGNDLSVTWDNTQALNTTVFESYRLYLLPSNIDINTTAQSYIKLLTNANLNSWTGDNTIKKDSLNQNLVGSGSYKMCMAIMGTTGLLGKTACSSGTILKSDVVMNAKILSAKFTSQTNLELTTDVTVDTDLSKSNGSLISFSISGTTLTGTSISNVNGNKINITIQNLNNLSATGSNLIIQTGAIHSLGGGYNNLFQSGTLLITDGQSPTITGYSISTPAVYNGYYNTGILVNFSFSENMKPNGYTTIKFDRVGGNNSSQKQFAITSQGDLSEGNHNIVVDLAGVSLVSGTIYDMTLAGQDLAGNTTYSQALPIKFDNKAPTIPTLLPTANSASSTPTVYWNLPVDDNGNGSGINKYYLDVYSGSNCSGQPIQAHVILNSNLSKQLDTLSNGNYSWNLSVSDNVGNISNKSLCNNFLVDTTIATISDLVMKDTVLNNSNYTQIGNHLNVSANLTNTNSGKIIADLSALTGNASHTGVLCSNPPLGITCNYNSGSLNYSFNSGFSGNILQAVRQIVVYISNNGGTQNTHAISSIIVDSTNPSVGTITSLSGTIGGNTKDVIWNGISDTNLNYLKFEYSKDAGNSYNLIGTGGNSGKYSWDISSLLSGNTYKFRITAYDKSSNFSITESPNFSIDKNAPDILPGVIISPGSGSYIKGNSQFTLLWNKDSITDVGGALDINPISFEYSVDNGTNYVKLASNIPNTGSYNWNVPNINSDKLKLKLIAIDNVGNVTEYVTNYNFTIDSINPLFDIGISTPPNGSYIKSDGFDIEGLSSDTNLKSIYYSFKNQTNNTYYNKLLDLYTGSIVWNEIINDISTKNYNVNTLIAPTAFNGSKYELIIKIVDKALNETLTVPRQYIGDNDVPIVTINNASGSYFNGSVKILGTALDNGAGLSSVKISIKKGNEYWNGSAFVGTEQVLSTNTIDNYSNWNYDFISPISDNDGQIYQIIVKGFDKAYKVNNNSTEIINIVLDKVSPLISNSVYTFINGGLYMGGDNFNITWNPILITDSGAGLANNPVKLEYFNSPNWVTIADNIANNGSYDWVLPEIDKNDVFIRISAVDKVGNRSYQNSSIFAIDSTPPTISNVETMDMDANGQLDSLKITLSESIKDSTINLNDFNILGVGVPTGWETGISSNDNVFILKFANTQDTSSTPTLNYIKGSLSDISGKKLESISNYVSLDKAVPRILKAEIFDGNSDGKLGRIEVKFSENIQNTTDISSFSLNNIFDGMFIDSLDTSLNTVNIYLNDSNVFNTDSSSLTLNFNSNTNWKDINGNQAGSKSNIILIDKAKPILVSANLKDTSGDYLADKIQLVFSESLTGIISGFNINIGSINSTTLVGENTIELGVSGILSTNPNLLLSYSGNILDNYTNVLDIINNRQVVENISPKLLSANTLDQNGNGKIDLVLLNFSESLTGSFSDFNAFANSYTINSYAFSGSSGVVLNLAEKQIYDTAATPVITVDSNTSVKDLNNNLIISQSTVGIDSVGPVITGARFDELNKQINLVFSETVSGSLNNSNFILSGATSNISNFVFVNGQNTAIITLDGTGIIYGVTEISLVANMTGDNLGNKQTKTYFSKISASVIINEVMNNGVVKYIELKNISSSTVDISGWILQNALGVGMDYTILPGQSILANGYYLIATNNTSFSGIIANQTASLNISSDIILKNGAITVDSAKYQIGTLNKSIERINGCGDGLNNACWYTAVASNGFNDTNIKGTPKTQNIFDATIPTLNLNMTGNTLLPVGKYNLKYDYSDNVAINTGSINFKLEKFDGVNWNSVLGYSTGNISLSNTSYSLNSLPYGKYKSSFSISDTSGNTNLKETIFYVDDFSMSISGNNIDLGELTQNVEKLANQNIIITIKTIGAGFVLNHNYTSSGIGDYVSGKGFGACIGNACNVLENFKNKQIVNQVGELQSSGSLKTYTYEIKYGAKIDSSQPAGVYNIDNVYDISLNY